MNATIKIPVSDIDAHFIEDLKAKYGEAELEINVRPAAHREVMPESEFWKVIGLLDWDKTGDK